MRHKVAIKLHGGEEALAADLVNERVPGPEGVETVLQDGFHPLDIAEDVVLQQVAGAGGGGGGGEGVAAEGAAVVAVSQRHGRFLGEEGADGDAEAQALGEDHHIRLGAVFLVAEQAAQPPHPRLHFVQDEQDVVAVAPVTEADEVVVVGDVDAAFALDGFHHHGDGVVGGGVHHGFHIVEVHIGEAFGDGFKKLVVVGLAGGGNGVHRAPVEGVEGGDDFVGAVFVQLAVAPRHLERPLHRLGAAVAKENPVHTGVFNQHLGDVQLGEGVELVGGLDEGGSLPGDGVHHHRRAVSQVVHRPAGHKVNVLLAVGIPHAGTLAAHDDHRPAAHGLGVVLLLNGDVFGVAGHRTWAPFGGIFRWTARRRPGTGVGYYTLFWRVRAADTGRRQQRGIGQRAGLPPDFALRLLRQGFVVPGPELAA